MPSNKDEFEAADGVFPKEAPIRTISNAEIMPQDLNDAPKGMMEHRDALIKKYHNGAKSLTERLKAENRTDIDNLVIALVEEVIKETDNLLGNELIATQSGNLRDATIISDKRASVLAQAIKAVQAKQEFEKERGGFDVDSPGMKIIFKFFMEKVREAFKSLNYNDEQSDIFFRALGGVLVDWKKELKQHFTAANSIGNNYQKQNGR